jgi:hypothetical protein
VIDVPVVVLALDVLDLDPGSGRDRVATGTANDRVAARGGVSDRVDCGPGTRDVVIVDRLDRIRRCDRVNDASHCRDTSRVVHPVP